MSHAHLSEEAIFDMARRIDSAELRADYVEQACAGDSNLKHRVAGLLEIHAKQESFLENPAIEPTAALSVTEKAGDQIGPFRLLQKIGEGGFGVVYMAEQTSPVRRRVALKIIKAGMDSSEIIARFEAERQALAMMEHPNIARVLDGGTTESGRPYFVMELVKGIALTAFCDENQLDTHQRLELFTTVCKAIQHAHQKGVIHRDIKPSNVMVTLHDGEPVVKVIDFGVAKAITQKLSEKTMFTAYGQMIGTPQYMSPEQAEMSGLDIDTRSDIYSLGVLLYELLTGATPIDPVRLRQTGYAEMQKMIRDEEPLRPSIRLSTVTDQTAKIAERRKSDPKKLGVLLKGELDWIVMKALEKQRDRRYDTATSLAEDVHRFLNGSSVSACPPTLKYQLQKFAKRNRVALTFIGSIMAVLLSGIVVSSSFALRASRAQQVATDNERQAQENLQALQEEQAKFRAARGEEALANALDHIFSARIDQAEQALVVAEQCGVSPGKVAIYRAAIAADEVDYPEGRKQSQLAVDALPQSLAARILWSYFRPGVKITADAVQGIDLNPQEPIELFTAARIAALVKPDQSLRWLEQLAAIQNSPAVYYQMGRAYSEKAGRTRYIADIEQCLKYVDAANASMPRSELTARRCVYMHLMASDAYLRNQNSALAEYHLAKAKRIANESWADNPNSLFALEPKSAIAAFEGNWDEALEWSRKEFLSAKSGEQVRPYIMLLLRTGNFSEAEIQEVSAKMSEFPNFPDILSWNLVVQKRGVDDAIQALKGGFSELDKIEDLPKPLVFWAYCLFGKPKKAIASDNSTYREAVLQGMELAPFEKAAERFMSGQLSESELRDACVSRFDHIQADFYVGMLRLGEGRRTEAYQCFERILEDRREIWGINVSQFEVRFADIYLNNMRRDPSWPHWIESADSEAVVEQEVP